MIRLATAAPRAPRRAASHLAVLALAAVVTAACGGSGDAATDSATADQTTMAPAPAPDSAAAPGMADAPAGGMLDPNTASREQLAAVPGFEAHAVDALIAGRPYANMVAVNGVLATHVPDSTVRKEIYARVWKPIDINTASAEEILLIPGVGRRMQHEFEEYRPYRAIEQFRREMGKYVDAAEVARLERYVMIPN